MKTTMTPVLNWCLPAAAVLLLTGCSATHVGESWQCPLAQGASCTSIAEADPAVPAGAAGSAVLFGEPLQGDHRPVDGAAACDRDCGPLAWLRGLFGSAQTMIRPCSRRKRPAAVAVTGSATGSGGEAPSREPDNLIAADASLRVPEVLGRIWIAPFVDADGIYREAHWVRVVLEPAGWTLP